MFKAIVSKNLSTILVFVLLQGLCFSPPTVAQTDIPPQLQSINRIASIPQYTNVDTLTWEVIFSEAVNGVDASDFSLAGTANGMDVVVSTIALVVGGNDGDTRYRVRASGGNLADLNATVSLSIISTGHGITDSAGNGLMDTTMVSGESYTVDNTVPELRSISHFEPRQENTNADTLTWLVTFSEAVSGVDAGDFNLAGTTATLEVRDTVGDSYRVRASGNDLVGLNATVSLSIDAAHGITDLAGHPLAEPAPTIVNDSYTVDNIAPTVMIENAPGTASSDFTVTINFNEVVTGFAVGSITVFNGMPRDLAGSGSSYIATITPKASLSDRDRITIDIAAAAAMDLAGNENTAATPVRVNFSSNDNIDPELRSIAHMTPLDAITNADTLTWEVIFSEAVTNVDAGDFSLTGAVNNIAIDISAITLAVVGSSGATSYQVTASGNDLADLNAIVILSIDTSHDITDIAGNRLTNRAPTTGIHEDYTVDNTVPELLSISRHEPTEENTNEDTLTWLLTFSEAVSGVDPSDFAVSNTSATLAVAMGANAASYEVEASRGNLAALNATVSLSIDAAHGITDLAGHPLADLASIRVNDSYTVDNTAAMVSIDNAPMTTSGTFTVAINFTEVVTGFVVTNIALVNATASNFTGSDGDASYSVDITPHGVLTGGETINIDIDADVALDLAGNGNTVATGVAVEFTPPDTTPPALLSIGRMMPPTVNTNADTLTWEVIFSEAVNGVDASDFSLAGTANGMDVVVSTIALVVGGNDGDIGYRVRASEGNLADLNATVSLSIISTGHGITDTTGNALMDTTMVISDSYTVDNTVPELLSISRHEPTEENTNEDTLTWLVTFSEAVSGVDPSDFAVSNINASFNVRAAPDAISYQVRANGNDLVSLNATVFLSIGAAHGITDLADHPLAVLTPTGDNESYTVDNRAPALLSISRMTPLDAITNAGTLTWAVVFSEEVSNVDANDFALSNTSAGITVVAGANAASYAVTASGGDLATLNASVSLSIDAAHDISNRVGNALAVLTPTGDNESYTVDNRAPALLSISRMTPLDAITNAGTLTWAVVFSEEVSNVDANDFALSNTSAGITVVAGANAASYAVTASGGDLATLNASVSLSIDAAHDISNRVGNALAVLTPTGDNESYTVDNRAPALLSISRMTPLDAITNAGTLTWAVVFSEEVSNVDANDFALSNTSAGITVVAGANAASYAVTASGGDLATLNASVSLSIDAAHDISNRVGNALAVLTPTGDNESYTVDNRAPALLSISRMTPLDAITNAGTLTWAVVFSEEVSNVDANDFALSNTSAGITVVAGANAASYAVTASGGDLATLNASVSLSIDAAHDISNRVGNALAVLTPTGDNESYTVDNRAPALLSISRMTPLDAITNAGTLTWAVVFSEEVSNVDANDFALSNTSAGITVVAGANAASYAVTASGGDLATLNASVSLSIDAAHDISNRVGNALAVLTPTGDNESYTVDNRAPALLSISRMTPLDAITNAGTLTWAVVFSEEVSNVDANDFALSNTSAGITVVAGANAASYAVTASGGDLATLNASVSLSIDAAHDISNRVGNALAVLTPTGDNESYTVDNRAPALLSISRMTPLDAITNAGTLTWAVVFSEEVSNVDANDFALSNTSAGITVVAGANAASYAVTASGGDLATLNASVSLSIDAAHDISNRVGNALAVLTPTGDNESYTVDNRAPALLSISRMTPLDAITNAGTLTWAVVFSEEVSNVDANDFALSNTSAGITVVAGANAASYAVTASGGDLATLNASVSLSIDAAHDISNRVGNALAVLTPTGDNESYTVDNRAPALLSISRMTPLDAITNAGTLTWAVVFSEEVSNVDANDFALSNTSAGITVVAGANAASYAVTASGGDLATLNASVSLSIDAAHDISNRVGNALAVLTPTGDNESYTVDNRAPALLSISRMTPLDAITNAGTLTWAVVFSEEVSNVDANDFALSNTSAGITVVAGANAASYAVTASGGDLATLNASVSLSIDAAHDISNRVGNALAVLTPTGDNESYTVDNRAPALLSISRMTPLDAITNAGTLTWAVVFSEEVSNVDANDFALSNTSAGITVVAGANAASYAVTASGGDLATLNASVSLSIDAAHDISNRVGNALAVLTPTGDNESYTVDNRAPALLSISRMTPLDAITNAGTLTWAVVFSEEVSNVDANDFALSNTSAGITVVAGANAASYAVTASGGDLATLNASVSLSIDAAHDISNRVGNALAVLTPTGDNESYTVDNRAPALLSISRMTPLDAITNAGTLTWAVVFSEEVSNVDANDFALSNTSAGITVVAGANAASYAVTASGGDLATLNASVSLSIDAAHDISNRVGNALAVLTPTGDNESYTVDNRAPALLSISRMTPLDAITNAGTLTWAVVFSEEVSNVDANDFALSNTSAGITVVAGANAASYAVTASGGDLATLNASVSLSIDAAHDISNRVGNALAVLTPTGDNESYTVDNRAPALLSISRMTPLDAITNAGTLTWAVVFSEEVSNVDANDFALSNTSAGITVVAGANAASYAVTASGGDLATLNASVSLSIDAAHDISNRVGNALAVLTPTGDNESYTVDNRAPALLSISRMTPLDAITNAGTLTWAVVFSEEVSNVDANDFALSNTSAGITVVAGANAASYAVTASGGDLATLNASVSLSIDAAHDISNRVGNALAVLTPTGDNESYTVDNRAPALLSISRMTPLDAITNAGTLTWAVVFSEEVSNVDANDFALSNTSAGITVVAGANAASYAVTASGGDLATLNASVSLSIDAAHDISNRVGNALAVLTPTGDNESYTVDNRAPALLSISRMTPLDAITNAGTLTWAVVFSEEVSNVDANDFALSNTSAGITVVAGANAASYAVTASGGDLATLNASVSLSIDAAHDISNRVGNALAVLTPTGDNESYTVDNRAPALLSISRMTPLDAITNAGTLTWAVVFSEEVSNVDANDFALSNTSAGITVVAGANAASYAVTASGGDLATLNASVSLSIDAAHDISNRVGNALAVLTPTGDNESYTVDNRAPALLSISRMTPLDAITNAGTLTWAVVFSEEVSNVDANDFALSNTSAGITVVAGANAASYAVTASGGDLATLNASVSLSIDAAHDISNRVGNALAVLTPTGDNESYTVDNRAPALLSISRMTPLDAITNAGTLTWAVVFSEEVSNVDANDFALSNTSAGITVVAGANAASYAVTASGGDLATLNASVSLSIDAAHDISNRVGNALAVLTPTGDNESYTVDNRAPALLSISRMTPLDAITNAGTLTWAVVFSEEVSNVDANDFALSNTSAGITVVAGANAASYAVTASGGDLATLNASVSLSIDAAHDISNRVGNALAVLTPTGDNESYTVDNRAPALLSISRMTPLDAITNAGTLTWAVVFSEEVSNVDANDFALSNTSAGITVVAGANAASYAVTASGGDLATLNASVSLSIDAAHDISNRVGNALAVLTPTGDNESYTVDNRAPALLSISRMTPLDAITNAGTLTWAVVFSEEVSNVDANDFALSNTSAGITVVAGANAASYAVTASGGDLATLNASVSLSIDAAHDISNRVGNALAVLTPTGDNESYTVDNRAPVAQAGVDQVVEVGELVTLDASGSADASPLTYVWTADTPNSPPLTGATTATPSFTATVAAGSELMFTVTVDDGINAATTDTVSVYVAGSGSIEIPVSSSEQTILGVVFSTPAFIGTVPVDITNPATTLINSIPSQGGIAASTFAVIYAAITGSLTTAAGINFGEAPFPVDVSVAINGIPIVGVGLDSAITVCLAPSASVQAAAAGRPLVLYHDRESNGNWQALSSSEERAGFVCGDTAIFSPFVVGFSTGAGRSVVAHDWLSRFGRSIASEAVEVIASRAESLANPSSHLLINGQSFNLDDPKSLLGGAASLAGLESQGQALVGRFSSLRDILSNSSFQWASGDSISQGSRRGWSIWGESRILRTEGKVSGSDLSGEIISGYLGSDYHWNNNILTGIALSHSRGDGDAQERGDNIDLETRLNSIYPYIHWALNDNLSLWGSLGYGIGDSELTDAQGTVEGDIDMLMIALGIRNKLFVVSDTSFALKGDAFAIEINADALDGNGTVVQDSVAQRFRLALETKTAWNTGLQSHLELGSRIDGGDAESGIGIDLGGGLSYSGSYLDIIAKGRWLALHKDRSFEEWGASLQLNLHATKSGRGLSFALTPAWGENASSEPERLWRNDSIMTAGNLESLQQDITGTGLHPTSLGLALGYGIGWRNLMITPYGEFNMQAGNRRRLRLGTRFELLQALSIEIFGEESRNSQEYNASEYSTQMQGSLKF